MERLVNNKATTCDDLCPFMSFYGNLTTSMVLNFAIKSNYRIIKFAVVNKRSYVNTACGTLPHAG